MTAFPRRMWSEPDPPIHPPFAQTLADAEDLLAFAAESGTPVPPPVAAAILQARSGQDRRPLDDDVQGRFYEAYTALAQLLGGVTAATIRNCTSASTRRKLTLNKLTAIGITVLIANVSVATFVADTLSSKILQDISTANAAAAHIRASLTEASATGSIPRLYAEKDPCTLLETPPGDGEKIVRDVRDVEALQALASTVRDLLGRALKLNALVGRVGWVECNPFGQERTGPCATPEPSEPQAERESIVVSQLQLNPAILNYTAEALCKIKTLQNVRTFATNVQADYAAIIGAFTAFALPIVYAWLGAYAYRLRLFSETIKKRTYHPSFADSARMITAVIAGAIVGLFSPAQGLALSPLATAFLVGYGVELFFRFLDTLIGAFGASQAARGAGK